MKLSMNTTVGDLRQLVSKRQYADIKDRLVAVIERRRGKSFRKIASSIGRSADFVKTWNDRFKKFGALGLLDKKAPPPSMKLDEIKRQKFKERVLAGPTSEDGVTVFRTADLIKILLEEFEVSYSSTAVNKMLKRLNIVRLRPRPVHEKNSPDTMKIWKEETLPFFFEANPRAKSTEKT
jgi:transposase